MSNRSKPGRATGSRALPFLLLWSLCTIAEAVPERRHFEQISLADGLSQCSINAIAQDRHGFLWFGTEDGLNRFDGEEFTVYRHEPQNPNSLTYNNVTALHEDQLGRLWVGAFHAGLTRFDPSSGQFTRYQADLGRFGSLSDDGVLAIAEDPSGAIWVATEDGLNCLDEDTGEFAVFRRARETPHSLSSSFVNTIFFDRSGALWIGTEGGGLCRLDRSTNRFTRYRHDPTNPTSLSEDHVFSIHEDRLGTLWLGTYAGGLNRFDRHNEVFASFTTRDGLPSNAVYGILEDDSGSLWLSTNLGLCRFDPRTGACRNCDARDGLQSNEFNGGAFHRGPRGQMFFGGINGFNRFFPERITDNPHVPQLVLTELQVFNRPVAIGEQVGDGILLERSISETDAITLSYRENVVSFEFAALHYVSPKQNRYAYFMEGFDRGWSEAGTRRFATYTSLPPGAYTFRIKAANSDGVWNQHGLGLDVVVTPPFWQTWWFRGLSFCCLIALVVSAHMLRTITIRRRNQMLQGEVEERKRAEEAMRKAMEVAREANQVRSEFLANISHEFRTPMNGIIGLTALTLKSELTAAQRGHLCMVRDSADSLLEIMENVFEFSKIESGSLDLVEHDFNLPELLQGTLVPLDERARAKGLALHLDVDAELPSRLKGDRNCLRQTLKQVIGNAIKFTEHGRIDVHVGTRPTGSDSVRLECRVHDTGIGIPSEDLETIFEGFRQVDGSTTRKYGGTGIGLSISRKLLRMMNGRIEAESKLGIGSIFRFSADFGLGRVAVPTPLDSVATRELAPDARVVAAANAEATIRRILLVEDVRVNQMVASAILKRAGHSVQVAENGQEALDAIAEGAFDLVLMDIQMPVMNGFEATERIRASEPATRDLPIVALTAHTLESDRERCF